MINILRPCLTVAIFFSTVELVVEWKDRLLRSLLDKEQLFSNECNLHKPGISVVFLIHYIQCGSCLTSLLCNTKACLTGQLWHQHSFKLWLAACVSANISCVGPLATCWSTFLATDLQAACSWKFHCFVWSLCCGVVKPGRVDHVLATNATKNM